MIPGDLASRLRMLTEASFFSGEPNVAPLARVKAISANLPDFTPGQRITASLQATAGQDNTYQARVDGREVILSLPQSVKAGDSLELIVSHVTPQAVFATLAQPAANTASQAALSQTGKLISFLLTGQPATAAASLNGGAALLPAAPQTGAATAQLANSLGTAIAQSGLFYESHQARWLSGQVDTASLLKEPQGRESAALLKAPSSPPAETAASTASAASAAATTKSDSVAPVTEKLLPLVNQQLDAIATHQLVWQGQVWPGQDMEWEIEDPARDRSSSDDEPDSSWNTTLRLTLPSLGGVEARLHLTPAGIAVRLIADDSATRNTLQAAESRLADALAAANVPLTGMVAELRQAP